jgi:hypothetical protein
MIEDRLEHDCILARRVLDLDARTSQPTRRSLKRVDLAKKRTGLSAAEAINAGSKSEFW